MKKIIYYVAISIDGYISRAGDDISGFVPGGNGVEQYLSDLQDYDTVIMGRKTYESGYKYGLVAGQPAYPHMRHYIFSNSLDIKNLHTNVSIHPLDIEIIKNLKNEEGSDIYLCGGGIFAGWLLKNKLIDVLKVKVNPLLIGEGVKLFENSILQYKLELLKTQSFDHGLQIIEYNVNYRQRM